MSDTYEQDRVEEAQVVERPEQGHTDDIRRARELIPVGPTGTAPMNFAQQVDFAKTMTQAKSALPAHLRNNAGDCLAIIDIATRAGMSPYMLASKTYVQNDRLCFESQAYHALAQSSGLMKGDFEITFEGEGGDRVCIITGYLKGDPRPKEHRSPPLHELHPGYSLKREENGVKSTKTLTYLEGQRLKREAAEKGETVQGLFCKGSQLWDRKPDVQMPYDTIRDWVRLYAPRATLGIYTPDEMSDYADHFGPENAKVVSGEGLKEKLGGADRGEGHKPGYASSELNNIAPNSNQAPQPAEKQAEPEKVKETTKPKRKTTKKKADKAEEKPAEPKPEEKAEEKPANAQPTTAAEYELYASNWIEKEKDGDNAEARWDGEYDLRKTCGVNATARNALRNKISEKFNR